MKASLLPAAVAAIVAVTPVAAQATALTLTFEGPPDGVPIGSFYSADGITFSANAFASIESNSGGTGNFQGEPSPTTAVLFAGGGPDLMDVAGGFTTAFSLFYTGIVKPGTVDIWSGLDATGTLLATLALPATPSDIGTGACTVADFCPFAPLGTVFPGTAHSVDFGGAADQFFFDNITLGANTLVRAPEPATLALLGAWLTGAAWARRRKRVATGASR